MDTRSSGRLHGARGFLLRLFELQIPMAVGALVCLGLGRLISDGSALATAYHPGTYLFAIGDVLFLTVPVVAWTLFREPGWRPGLEIALAMIAPVAIIALAGEIARYPYLLWLVTGMYPAMSLGMIAYIFYRGDQPIDRNFAPAQTRVDRAI